VFTVLVWGQVLTCNFAGGAAAVMQPSGDIRKVTSQDLTPYWIGRSEQYARAIADPEQQTAAWMGVAAFHGRQGDFDAAQAAARRIADPDARLECLRYVAIRIARSGDFPTARRFAHSIDEPLTRASALAWVARVQAECHEFDAARQTIALVADPGQLAWAWHQLAYEEAAAGRYAEALADAGRIVPAGPDDRLLKEDLLAWIGEARAAGQREPAKPPADTPAAQARQLLGPLGYRGLSSHDLGRLKREAEGTVPIFAQREGTVPIFAQREGTVPIFAQRVGTVPIFAQRKWDCPLPAAAALDKATAWRRVAWIHLVEGDAASARAALAYAEGQLGKLASPADRAVQGATVADLYLELGDPASAKRVLLASSDSFPGRSFGTSGTRENPLADYRVAALIVGVVARVEGPERAVALVQSNPEACRAAWWAAGAFCGWLARPEVLLPLLETPADAHRKFALSMGAAQGMTARRRAGPDRALSQAPGSGLDL